MKSRPGHHLSDYADVLEALGLLLIARPICRYASLDRIEGLLPTVKGKKEKVDIGRVTLAVERAARRLPGRVSCFPRAFCGAVMLRRRGHASHLEFGLQLEQDRMSGHVTANIGPRAIIGGEHSRGYTTVRHMGVSEQNSS